MVYDEDGRIITASVLDNPDAMAYRDWRDSHPPLSSLTDNLLHIGGGAIGLLIMYIPWTIWSWTGLFCGFAVCFLGGLLSVWIEKKELR